MGGMGPGAHSSLVILVPSAREAADRERRRLDRKTAWAIPVHITLLFPFAELAAVSAEVVTRLAGVCRQHAPFAFQLGEVGWFGDRVLYLGPRPAEPFVALSGALAAAFPEHPPYEGAYAETIPHLTVGENSRPARMRRSARRLERRLPITGEATEVCLIAPGDDGRWNVTHRFPLESAAL